MKWLKQTRPLLLILIVFILCLIPSNIPVSISLDNTFNLYFQNGDMLQFQYFPATYGIDQFLINITVTSGVLNGTNGVFLTTWSSGEGSLRFDSQNSASLSCPECDIYVNKVLVGETGSILNGDNVKIVWYAPIIEPLFPIMFMFGMVGLIAMFIAPLYAINKIKQKRYYDGFVYGLVIGVIGIALFIAWLWG